MKKKIGIIISILAAIVFLIYLNIRGNNTTETINQGWSINENEISHISILGSEQDLNIKIIVDNFSRSSVDLKGKISKKTVRFLKNTKDSDDSLEVRLSDYNAPRFMLTNENKNTLEVEIRISNMSSLKVLEIESVIGNIDIDFPKNFVAELDLKPQNGGEIIEHSKIEKNGKTKVLVSTIGNIEY